MTHPAMPAPLALSPYHVGEALVARLLQALLTSQRIGELEVQIPDAEKTKRTFTEVFGASFPERILPTVSLKPLGGLQFDPMHQIDCAAVFASDILAMELKLGSTAFSTNGFKANFREGDDNRPRRSSHKDPRVAGSMVAILDENGRGRVDGCDGTLKLSVCVDRREMPVRQGWVLVIRRALLKAWHAEQKLGEALGMQQLAAILTLEDVAEKVGIDNARKIALDLVGESIASWFPDAGHGDRSG